MTREHCGGIVQAGILIASGVRAAQPAESLPVAKETVGSPVVYAGENLRNIQLPVGGNTAGEILFDGQGRAAHWHIFNNFRSRRIPSALAVRATTPDGKSTTRMLCTDGDGPFPGMADGVFSGELPYGWYDFRDPGAPFKADLEVYSPLIPLNVKDSSIPCAILNVTVGNTGHDDLDIELAQALAHPFAGKDASAPVATVAHGNAVLLAMRQAGQGKGSVVLALPDGGEPVLLPEGRLEGAFDAPTAPTGDEARAVAVRCRARLRSRESRRFTVVLTWHIPGARHGTGDWGGEGNYYENWWGDATAVARYVLDQLPRIEEETRRFHDTLYAGDMPRWLIDRIINPFSCLRSRTVFWTRDGFFGGYEGSTEAGGQCGGNCNHVWHYAQGHARLWPALGRRIRGQQFEAMREDGAIPFRLPAGGPAFDGQCGDILGAYREHLLDAEGEWLAPYYPRIKQALLYLIEQHDPDEDGVPSRGAMHHTLDADVKGPCSWLGSLYLAALSAGERMALLCEDQAFAERCARLWTSGRRILDEQMWNGSYYQGTEDNYAHGIAVDQVLGQWWADNVGLPHVFPADRVRSGMAELMRHNFVADPVAQPSLSGWWAGRRYTTDYQDGLIMICWPDGKVPRSRPNHHNGVLAGFEQAAAATMFSHGMLDEGLKLMRAIADRYDGRLHTGLNGRFGRTSGNPFGDDECGRWYFRGLSSWSLLTALQGFRHDGPGRMIGFAPTWRPEAHRTCFVASEGWGLYRQTFDGARLTCEVELRYGRLRLRQFLFGNGQGRDFRIQSVRHGAWSPAFCSVREQDWLRIEWDEEITLNAGDTLVMVGEAVE